MHRPFVALQVIPRPFAGFDVVTGDPKILAARRLQVIPDGFAAGTEKFMAGDFHDHGAGVDLGHLRAVGADGPDAVHLVPRAFVTKQEQVRIGW